MALTGGTHAGRTKPGFVRPGGICMPVNRAQIWSGSPKSPGKTTIGVDWPSGPDVPVTNLKSWVQRASSGEPLAVLGWQQALETYRPLLRLRRTLRHPRRASPASSATSCTIFSVGAADHRDPVLDAEVKRLGHPPQRVKKAADAFTKSSSRNIEGPARSHRARSGETET